jgi:hypothetical protein
MANATITVLEADGLTQTDVIVLDVGRQAAAASKSIAMSTEDKAQLDAAVTALQILDDWDETDRAKVNIIAGQAGVAGGAGAVGATTQRMTLASDDPAVTALQIIDNIVSGSNALVAGAAAENAAAAGNPVLVGGRYDASDRTLGDGDVGAVALTAKGQVKAVMQTSGGTTVDPVVQKAHSEVDAGEPVKIGTKAIAALSGVTLVAAADRSDAYGDLDGAVLVRANGAIGDYVNGNASNTDGTSTQVLAAGAAGIKHYITDVLITNTSASNIYVELKDGTTVKATFPVPANGGVVHSFATPIGGTAATAWNFDPSAAASTVYCSVSGFKSKI